jgi:predicted phage terminase large subunit-like protein
LDAFKDKWEFPELKQQAHASWKEWQPDAFVIEAKAAGAPLVFELRRMGIPVSEYTPSRGNDKFARLNSVTDLFASGKVWAPDTRWADEVIEEMARFPNAEHDDLCLDGDTRILMSDGSTKRLRDVVFGEYVATPDGARKVLASFCTGMQETIEIKANGNTIYITGNHPVMTEFGWKRADSISLTDSILVASKAAGVVPWVSNHLATLKSKLSGSMAGITGSIQTQAIRLIETIFLAQMRFCTEMFGSIITGKSRMVFTSITKTATQSTTESKTWSAFQHPITYRHTKQKDGQKGAQEAFFSIWKTSDHWLLSGINRKKVEHGTGSTPNSQLASVIHSGCRKNNQQNAFVKFVTNRFLEKIQSIRSVLRHVIPQKETPKNVNKNWKPRERVLDAASSSTQCKPRKSIATQYASSVFTGPASKRMVFNLTVEGAHCYFANNILVHNCDSATQALIRFRQGGFLRLQSDEEDEPLAFRRKKAYY